MSNQQLNKDSDQNKTESEDRSPRQRQTQEVIDQSVENPCNLSDHTPIQSNTDPTKLPTKFSTPEKDDSTLFKTPETTPVRKRQIFRRHFSHDQSVSPNLSNTASLQHHHNPIPTQSAPFFGLSQFNPAGAQPVQITSQNYPSSIEDLNRRQEFIHQQAALQQRAALQQQALILQEADFYDKSKRELVERDKQASQFVHSPRQIDANFQDTIEFQRALIEQAELQRPELRYQQQINPSPQLISHQYNLPSALGSFGSFSNDSQISQANLTQQQHQDYYLRNVANLHQQSDKPKIVSAAKGTPPKTHTQTSTTFSPVQSTVKNTIERQLDKSLHIETPFKKRVAKQFENQEEPISKPISAKPVESKLPFFFSGTKPNKFSESLSGANIWSPAFVAKTPVMNIKTDARKSPPRIGLIVGTGFASNDELIKDQKLVEIEENKYGKASVSHAISGKINDCEVFIIFRHGHNHSINPTKVNYRANLWALAKQFKCQIVIATTACGSLAEELPPGHVILFDQYIDRTTKREQSFYTVCHMPQSEPFDPDLRSCFKNALKRTGYDHRSNGTIVVIEGPRFSTKAESHMYRSWNAHAVGMTTVPEAPLATELGVHYVSLGLVTDYDCWRETDESNVSVHQVEMAMSALKEKAQMIICEAIRDIQLLDWTPLHSKVMRRANEGRMVE